MKWISGVLVAVFIASTSANAADKIRIGIPGIGAQFMAFPLAQKKGFLKDEGLEAEIIRIIGTVAIAALVSAELDYWTAIGFTARSAIQGIPVRVVQGNLPVYPASLVGGPQIKSVKDLKGKTIAVSVFGGGPDIIARLVLKHFGLDPEKDVKFIAAGSGESRIAAVKQGLLAATILSVPSDSQAVKLGLHILARAHELLSYPEGGLVATTKKIKERPDETKRLIRAGIKANRYIRTEREGTIQFLVDWMKIDRELATATYDALAKSFSEDGSVPENGLRFVIEENKKIAKASREVALNDVSDFLLLREAQKELGMKGK
jgi:ABC-type nitrate/sulfonate/bicarbonate transport system substrate-binding protein